MPSTIEGLFVEEYKLLKGENADLKEQLNEYEGSKRVYGVFDLGSKIDLVKVNLEGRYTFIGDSYKIVQLGSEKLREILDYTDTELLEWAKSFNYGSWSSPVLEIKRKAYRYTLAVTDLDGTKQYAFDPGKDPMCVKLEDITVDYEEHVNEWVNACYESPILDAACDTIRDYLLSAIDAAEKKEAEAAQNQQEDAISGEAE